MTVPSSLLRRAAEVEGWLELGCPERALAKLQPLIDHPASRLAGLRLRAAARIGTGDHAGALRDLAEVREQDANIDVEWLEVNEGWCRKRTDDLAGAIACMERLIARRRRSAIAHFNLGCYLALQGETDRAIDELTIGCGLDDRFRAHLATETDLDSLRGDPRFQELLPR